MRKKVTQFRWVFVTTLAGLLTLSLYSSALAADFYWHNLNGAGDNKWENACYWDQWIGGCDTTPPTTCGIAPSFDQGWVIIKTTGDGNDCQLLVPPDGRPEAEAAAGDGPIVDAATVTALGDHAGGYALVVNNNLEILAGGSVRTRAWSLIGSGVDWDSPHDPHQGVVNVYGTFLGNNNQYVGLRDIHLGRGGGSGILNVYAGGEAYTPNRRIYCGASLDANEPDGRGTGRIGEGIINVYGGWLHCALEFRVGDVDNGGHGTVNQYDGLIEILGSGWEITAYNNSTINLTGGELYSNAVPIFGESPDTSAMYIDGGKLRVTHSAGNVTTINNLITGGKIVGTGGSIDPNDGNWKLAVVPEIASKYGTDTYTIQSPIPTCEMNAIPAKEQSMELGIPATDDVQYTVTNEGTGSINYAVQEVDSSGNPTDYVWLTLDKTNGTIAGSADGKSGGTDPVTATVDTTTMTPAQNYTAYLAFTEDCSTVTLTRSISVLVKRWDVDPPEPSISGDHEISDASITAYLNCLNPQTYTYTVTNLGDSPLSYTVQETNISGTTPTDYTWVDLSKPGGGPINPGDSDTLTVTLTGTGHGTEYMADVGGPTWDARWDGWLKFTNSQNEVEMRQVQMDETWLGALFGHVREYRGDVAPHDELWLAGADGPCGPGCNFNLIGAQTGTVVLDNSNPDPDYNAQNNYALKIDEGTTTIPGPDPIGRNGYASDVNMGEGFGGNNNNFNSRIGNTMVARIKCVRSFQMGANLWIRDDNNGGPNDNEPWGAGCRVRWNENNLIYEFVNDVGPINVGSAKPLAYHIVRIIDGWGPYGKHTLKIWVDEDKFPGKDPDIDVSGALAEGEGSYDAFCFGTFGGNSHSEIYYDWITFTNAGMYGPGEAESCLGRSLIPTFCPDPFADADGDDDVDQDDFAEFQRCYTAPRDPINDPPSIVPEGCDCFDQEPTGGDGDVDENDFNRFQNCASGPEVPANPCCDDPHVCGDGVLCEVFEECDDGNTTPGDGCSATCTIE